MNNHLFKPKYLVRFQGRSPVRWDGKSPLKLGHPARYLIEKRGNKIWVRNFIQEAGLVHPVKSFDLESLASQSAVILDDFNARDTLTLRTMTDISAVNWAELA